MSSILLRRCLGQQRRSFATATLSSSASASSSSSPARRQSVIPLSNVEAQWEKMSAEDKVVVGEQLEELMKKDWKQLSLEEKKAAYFVSFGPHGPRTPSSKPGDGIKIFASVLGLVGVAGLMQLAFSWGHEKPKTLTKEWQDATSERAKEQKLNPITGISSEGYKGKGFAA